MAIEAVIWDFGGVISDSPFDAFLRFERERGLPEGFLRSVNARNPDDNAWALLERSACTAAEFDELFAAESAALRDEVRGAEVLALLDGAIRREMVEAWRGRRAGLTIGHLTCAFRRAFHDAPPMPDRAGIMGLVHRGIECARAGVRWPDPRIYRMMTEALEVEPRACIYLDALGINLKPARAMGMHTIKVMSPGQALDELEALVGFPLRG